MPGHKRSPAAASRLIAQPAARPGSPLDAAQILRARGLKRLLPRGLFGRSLLLLALPVVLAQFFFLLLFYERLYDELTVRASEILVRELHLAFAWLGEARTRADWEARLAEVNETLLLEVRFPADGSAQGADDGAAAPGAWTRLRASLPISGQLRAQLQASIGAEHLAIRRSKDNRSLILRVSGAPAEWEDGIWRGGVRAGAVGPVEVVLPRKRLLSSTWHTIAAWATLFSLLLIGLAAWVLRNQVRSLSRLAEAADRFGRDLVVENFRPAGAYEVRRSAIAFIRMRDRLRRHLRERNEFLAGVGHDLRTPLSRLRLGLAILPESRDRTLLEREVATMDRLVSLYLSYVRGEGQESPSRTDLADLLGRSLAQVSGVRPEITRSLVCEPDLAGELREQATQRAVQNLLENALRFARTMVRLRAYRLSPDRLEICVEDDGPGIPEADRERVLQPFFMRTSESLAQRGEEDSEEDAPEHLGLGLAIANDLVLHQGGSLVLEEPPSGGLLARLRLPALPAKA